LAGCANDQRVTFRFLFKDVQGFAIGRQAFPLPDGIKSQPLVLAEQLPVGGPDFSRLGGGRSVIAQKLWVIFVVNETQVLAIGCVRHGQTKALRDSPHFRFSQFTEGKDRPLQLTLSQVAEHIGLVFSQVTGAPEFKFTIRSLKYARIMTCCHVFSPMCVSKVDELSPLDGTVAENAWIGCFISQVACDERAHDLPLEGFASVHDVEWDS